MMRRKFLHKGGGAKSYDEMMEVGGATSRTMMEVGGATKSTLSVW